MKRYAGAAVVALLVLGALVGVVRGAGGGDSARMGKASMPVPAAQKLSDPGASGSAADSDMGAGAASVAAPAAAGGSANAQVAPTTGMDQKIVKSASIRLQVKDGQFRSSFDAASRVAGAHGGFVVSTESSAAETGGTDDEKDGNKKEQSSGVVVLRVPATAFDAARADLLKLGDVKQENISGKDVSGEIVDLDARLRSLAAQEEATRQLMAKAKTIGETVEVQGHLTNVRQQIEQLTGQKALLENQAALSTLRVEVFEPGAAVPRDEPKGEPSTLREAVTAAVNGAETVVAGTIIVLGWAIPLAVLATLGWLAYRPFGRRRLAALAAAQDGA